MAWEQVGVLKKYLDRYREQSGKTVRQIAEQDFGTTEGTLRFWLSGTRPPKRENLVKIIQVLGPLGCTLDQLVGTPESTQVAAPSKNESLGNIVAILGYGLSPEDEALVIETTKRLQEAGRKRLEMEQELARLREDVATEIASKPEPSKVNPKEAARQVVLQRARTEGRDLTSRELELLKMTEQEKKAHRKPVPALAKKGKGGK